MITLVEAFGYRCLRHISQPLGPFHVLVGPNGSGKTTFLDVIAFLGHLMSEDVEDVVRERTSNFYDLLWQRAGHQFKLAIEASIPDAFLDLLARRDFETVRYEIILGIAPDTQELGIQLEQVFLVPRTDPLRVRPVVLKAGDQDIISTEVAAKVGSLKLKLGPRNSVLRNLPSDESKFPVSLWLRNLLATGVQQIVLNSLQLRRPSPPGQTRTFKPDGSNLPWVIADLERRAPERKLQWIAHLQTSLPDIKDISTIERPEDRHRYLVIRYRGGLEVPSWMVSDGTLRMLALTLPAYLPDLEGIYLVEEPENGIHPRAIETVYQSLSSVYGAQVLLATHSPIILNLVEAEQVLCFAKTPEGATDIVRGSEHPALAEWRKETSLGLLFAAGVLG
jgi:predicted ATPase